MIRNLVITTLLMITSSFVVAVEMVGINSQGTLNSIFGITEAEAKEAIDSASCGIWRKRTATQMELWVNDYQRRMLTDKYGDEGSYRMKTFYPSGSYQVVPLASNAMQSAQQGATGVKTGLSFSGHYAQLITLADKENINHCVLMNYQNSFVYQYNAEDKRRQWNEHSAFAKKVFSQLPPATTAFVEIYFFDDGTLSGISVKQMAEDWKNQDNKPVMKAYKERWKPISAQVRGNAYTLKSNDWCKVSFPGSGFTVFCINSFDTPLGSKHERYFSKILQLNPELYRQLKGIAEQALAESIQQTETYLESQRRKSSAKDAVY